MRVSKIEVLSTKKALWSTACRYTAPHINQHQRPATPKRYTAYEMSKKQKTSRTLALFDVDGTLTVPRQVSRDDVPQMHSGVPDTTTLFNDTVRFWQEADETMLTFMKTLREVRTAVFWPNSYVKLRFVPLQKVTVGIVGGSDLVKIREQLGENGVSIFPSFLFLNIWVFPTLIVLTSCARICLHSG